MGGGKDLRGSEINVTIPSPHLATSSGRQSSKKKGGEGPSHIQKRRKGSGRGIRESGGSQTTQKKNRRHNQNPPTHPQKKKKKNKKTRKT